MLTLYRAALRVRRAQPGFATDDLGWRTAEGPVLEFERGAGLRCVVNLGADAVPLGPDGRVLLASVELDGRNLPGDAAVWLAG
jgi:alpha-glucosidase